MSGDGYLTRLALRATQPATGLRPRVRSPYERSNETAEVFEEYAGPTAPTLLPETRPEEVRAAPQKTVPAGARLNPMDEAEPRPRGGPRPKFEPVTQSATEVSTPVRQPRSIRRKASAAPEVSPVETPAGPAAATPAAGTPTSGVGPDPPPAPARLPADKPPSERRAFEADSTERQASLPGARQEPPTGTEELTATAVSAAVVVRDPPSPAYVPKPAEPPPHQERPAEAMPPDRPVSLPRLRAVSPTEPSAGPEVTVSIGRIEVLPPVPEKPPPARATRESTAPSLADYLRDRSRR